MKPSSPIVVTTPDVLGIIDAAREAEACRDIAGMRKILEPIWPDIDDEPEFSGYPLEVEARLDRTAGFLLTYTAKSRGIASYHPRAKDLLTRSIRLFEDAGLGDEAAEARVILAFAFWHAGEVAESGLILNELERQFAGNSMHPVRLQIMINRLMVLIWNRDYEQAASVVQSLQTPISLSTDSRLIALFHMEAGILSRLTGALDESVVHYSHAIDRARAIKSPRLVATNLNNLAMTYKSMGRFDIAHGVAASALRHFEELGDGGWIAMVRDTQAQIYLEEGRLEDALTSVDSAIVGFDDGRDWANMIESLWVRCRCLFRAGRSEEGFVTYTELQDIAATRIGQVATERFSKAIASEIYVLNSLPFNDEVAAFKKSLVSRSLTASHNAIGAAAKRLGVSHQCLSEMINTQFPELYDELGMKRRARRSTTGSPASGAPNRIVRISNITGVRIRGVADKVRLFYFPARAMRLFGYDQAAAVAVAPEVLREAGSPVLYLVDGELFVARIDFDANFSQVYFVMHDDEPITLDGLNAVGTPNAFCGFEDLRAGEVEFLSL